MKKVLNIFGIIGESLWDNTGTTPTMVSEAISSLGEEDELEIHFNSPGGSVTDGLAISNLILNAKCTVTAYIEGIAASMAGVIACACDNVVMRKNSYVMIHNPWMYTVGDAESLMADAKLLNSFKGQIIDIYSRYMPGVTRDDISSKMTEEMWLDSAAAREAGFKFNVSDEVTRVAACTGVMEFSKMPETAKAMYTKVAGSSSAGNAPGNTPSTVPPPVPGQPAGASGSKTVTGAITGVHTIDDILSVAGGATELTISVACFMDVAKTHKDALNTIKELETKCSSFDALAKSWQSKHDKAVQDFQKKVDDLTATNNDLTAKVEAGEVTIKELNTQLGMVATAAFRLPSKGASTGANPWEEALNACGGDYVKARQQFPDAWATSVQPRKR